MNVSPLLLTSCSPNKTRHLAGTFSIETFQQFTIRMLTILITDMFRLILVVKSNTLNVYHLVLISYYLIVVSVKYQKPREHSRSIAKIKVYLSLGGFLLTSHKKRNETSKKSLKYHKKVHTLP